MDKFSKEDLEKMIVKKSEKKFHPPAGKKSRMDPDTYAVALKNKNQCENEKEIIKTLSMLGAVCPHFTLSEAVIEAYDKVLSQFGYAAALKAVKTVFATRTSSDPFPSLAALIELADPTVADIESAVEIADRIWLGIAQYGYCGESSAKKRMGPLVAKIIDSIGWSHLCSSMSAQAPIVKAQIRETARSIIERERRERVRDLLGEGIQEKLLEGPT